MTEPLNFLDYAYEKEPDIEMLKKALENNTCRTAELTLIHDATQLKYQAMIVNPTTIEKTMSPEQLFNAQNPLWAQGYTVHELYYYVKHLKQFDSYDQIKELIQNDAVTIKNSLKLIENTTYGTT